MPNISVFLGGSVETRRIIRCILCGKVVAEANGEVRQISIGDAQPGNSARAVVVQCRCKTYYSFLD